MTVAARSVPRLEDGTPYFGRLGELAYDPDEDRVQCHLCGEWFRFFGGSHLRRTHGWTLAGYREAFRLPVKVATCSRELRVRHSVHARSEIERGSGFGTGVGVPVQPASGGPGAAMALAGGSPRARVRASSRAQPHGR